MTEKDYSIFIKHILEAISNVEKFMKEIDKERFIKNEEKQSAVIRQIEIIGEATKNVPPHFRNKYPKVAWKEIAGTRDKIIHHYFGVDINEVWKIVKKDIPILKSQMKDILENS